MKKTRYTKDHLHHLHMRGYSLKPEEMPIEPQEKAKQSPAIGHSSVLRPPLAGFMAYLLLMFLLVFFVDYASAQKNILKLPIDSSQFFGNYDESGNQFYFLYFRPEYKKLAIIFNNQEASVPRQGLDKKNKRIDSNIRYYEIGRFFIDDYLYKLVIFKGNESDSITGAMSIHLNSYNSEGIMLDALALDTRLSSEGFEVFQKFKIKQNLIGIDYYQTDYHDYNTDLPVENPVPYLFCTAQYRIDSGRFILISKIYPLALQH